MPKIKVKGQTVQTGERPQTNGRTHTHTHTHGRYQTYYLPCYAVDKDESLNCRLNCLRESHCRSSAGREFQTRGRSGCGRFADKRYADTVGRFADTYNCIKTAFHDTDILADIGEDVGVVECGKTPIAVVVACTSDSRRQ